MPPLVVVVSDFPEPNPPNGLEVAGAVFAGSSVLCVFGAPKLKDPSGAGAGLSAPPEPVAPVLGAPKVKLPIGAGLSVVAGGPRPKEGGAESFFGCSTGLDERFAKENGVGAATTGVVVPEFGPDFVPKKFGTSPDPDPDPDPDSLVDVVEGAGAEGLPRPKLNPGLPLAPPVLSEVEGLGGAKSDEAGAGGCTGALAPEREKNPFSLGVTRD